MLIASFEGIILYRCDNGSGDAMKFEKVGNAEAVAEERRRAGVGDVGVGTQDGKRFFASIEPWHGNEVVIYTRQRRQRGISAR